MCAVNRSLPKFSLIALLGAVLFLLVAAPASASPTRGDANCSGATDASDALDMLLTLAGEDVTVPDECAPIGQDSAFGLGGDVDCDGDFGPGDVSTSLRIAAGIDVDPCLAVMPAEFGHMSEELGYEGGTLTTAGLDGTTFTLRVPEGALAAPELISMTPVASVDNLPIDGGLVAAVDLQPSGLLLWEPALLTIDPPSAVPVGDQTAFVISQGEFVQHPFVLDSAEMTLPLMHFSAAGIGAGAVESVSPPTLEADAYTARVAPLVTDERAALLGGGPGNPGFEDVLAAIIDPYVAGLIDSLNGATGTTAVVSGPSSCLAAAQLLPLAFGYSSQAQAIGGGGAYSQLVRQALQSMSASLGPCRQQAFSRCVDEHDLNAIALIVVYSRAMETLGIESNPSPLDQMIENCGRFELLFSGEFCVDVTNPNCTGGIHYEFLVGTGFYFSMSATPGAAPLGTAQLEMVQGQWGPYGGCEGETTSPGSTFEVVSGGVSMNPRHLVDPRALPEVTLIINPGIPPETLELNCPWGSDTQYATLWWQKWCSWHQPELTPPYANTTALCFYNDEPDGWDFAVTDWSQNYNYPPMQSLTKEWERSYAQVGVLEIGWEKSHVTLIHAPIR